MEDQLRDKLKELAKVKDQEMIEEKETKDQRQKLSWKEEVNKRRRLVAAFLQQQATRNISEACRFTGCSYQLVKRVSDDLDFTGFVTEFDYPNQKTRKQQAELTESISSVNGSYSTISDLKRRHPDFSKRLIARQLKATGHRWLLMRKNMKTVKKERYNDKEVLAVVQHLAQSLSNNQVDTFYLDEVHFPLAQTSDHHWTLKDYEGHDLYYNRRQACDEKLSAIAMCSTSGFVAIQIFKKEICGEDFLFFIQEAFKKVPHKTKISVLADNASWHKAECVSQSKAFKALHFNAPGLFQANLIENAFSFIRSEFRKRPLVDTVEEEAALLLQIFFDDYNTKRFEGIARNHIRSLQALLYKHYSAIASRMHRTTNRKTRKLR